MKQTYYHATPKENVRSIKREGIHASEDMGVVFLTKSVDDALMFMEVHHPKGGLFAVFPILLDESEVHESHDHNKKYIPCDAYYHEGDIPADLIPKSLNDILLFRLTRKK